MGDSTAVENTLPLHAANKKCSRDSLCVHTDLIRFHFKAHILYEKSFRLRKEHSLRMSVNKVLSRKFICIKLGKERAFVNMLMNPMTQKKETNLLTI